MQSTTQPTSPLPLDSAEQLMRFAYHSARSAGLLSLEYFRQPTAVDNKAAAGQFDPVTAADKAVEQSLRDALAKRFPDHGILGEEFGETGQGSAYRWVIDPIDGTRSFISGVPAWGVLLGLQHEGNTVLGLMHQPYLKETFVALTSGSDTQAWFMRDEFELTQPLHVSNVGKLKDATLFCTHPEIFAELEGGLQRFERVAEQAQLMRYGGDCYCYSLLAMGQVDLVVEAGLQAYDIQPLIPLIEAAGGVVSDWQGKPLRAGGDVVAAATAELHAEALQLLK